MARQLTLRTCSKGHQYYKSTDCPTCPVCEKENAPAEDFLSLLGAPARRALEREGITTVQQLSQWSEEEILQLHGVGPSSIPKLKSGLQKAGLSFKSIAMVDNNSFRKMVFQFENVEEQPHFYRRAFRIKGKNIFATLDEKEQTANLKLTELDQSVFCQIDNKMIYPVAGAWGQKGWTTINLKTVSQEILGDALKLAYESTAKKKK